MSAKFTTLCSQTVKILRTFMLTLMILTFKKWLICVHHPTINI